MNKEFWKFRTKYLPALIAIFSLSIGAPALWAQQDQDPLKAWATLQKTVKDMETAVQSKNLHGIHEPSMKIRPAIRSVKGHNSMLSEDKAKKIGSALEDVYLKTTQVSLLMRRLILFPASIFSGAIPDRLFDTLERLFFFAG